MEPCREGGSKQRFAGGSIVCHFAPEVLGYDSGGTYDFLRSVWSVLLVLGLWDTVVDLVVGLVDLIPVVVDISFPTRNLVGEKMVWQACSSFPMSLVSIHLLSNLFCSCVKVVDRKRALTSA